MSNFAPHPLEGDAAPKGEPRELFAAAAVRVGLIPQGDPIDQNLVDFAMEIVTLAARVADRYTNPDCADDTVGDVIRGHLFDV